jgi:hypothetical protein
MMENADQTQSGGWVEQIHADLRDVMGQSLGFSAEELRFGPRSIFKTTIDICSCILDLASGLGKHLKNKQGGCRRNAPQARLRYSFSLDESRFGHD